VRPLSVDCWGILRAGAQKAKAFETANAFCTTKGREVEAVSEHETDSGFGKIASADLEFRCVSK
jgi:hypothetical protein